MKFPKGWKVFPCFPDSKKPAIENWSGRATDDPIQIAEWEYEFGEKGNWGLAMGASGLAALDVDGATGADSLMLLELEHGPLPETRKHATPSGGFHLIFTDTERKLSITASKIAPKLDTRGGANGKESYIVIPPSSIGGKGYSVISDDRPADVPAYLIELCGQVRERTAASSVASLDDPTNVERASSLLRDYVARGDVAREGSGGDARTYQVAAEVLNFGLSEETTFQLIDTIWNVACVPPWTEEDLRVKIQNAAHYSQNEVGSWAVPPASAVLTGAALDRLASEVPQAPEPEGRTQFKWLSEQEFSAMPEPQWLIEDLFVRKTVAMLFGPPANYKSFIALHFAASVAMKGECAFYVAAEGISRMARRDFPAWKLAYAQTEPLPFFMQEQMPRAAFDAFNYDEFAASIREKAAGRPIGIIFLDTLNRAMLGLEENSAKDAAALVEAAYYLSKTLDTTVVLVHHTPADGTNPRGSSVWLGNLDTLVRVEADKKIKLAKVRIVKQKAAEEREIPFYFEGHRFGPGMAFTEIEPKKAALMSADADLYNPRNIAASLRKLGIVEPEGITSDVLAVELVPAVQDETIEERNDVIARTRKGLMAAVKAGRLDGFYKGEGRGIRWSLPAPNKD